MNVQYLGNGYELEKNGKEARWCWVKLCPADICGVEACPVDLCPIDGCVVDFV